MVNIQDEIIKTIELMVDKAIGDKTSTEFNGVVTSITDKGTYMVSSNGNEIEVCDGVGCNPSVGSSVWVHNPVGTTTNSAYIAGVRGKSASVTGNESNTSTLPTYSLSSRMENGKHYIILSVNGREKDVVEDFYQTAASTNSLYSLASYNSVQDDDEQTEYATKNDITALFTERGL